MSRWVLVAWVLVAWGLVAAAAGCSTSHRLDREALEARLVAELVADAPGAVEQVRCPELSDPVPGRSFVCAAQLGDDIIDVPVRLGGTAEALEARVELTDRLVAADEIAGLLAATFTEEVEVDTTVDCGHPVVVLEVDEQLRCEARDPRGVVRIFLVTVDSGGDLHLELR